MPKRWSDSPCLKGLKDKSAEAFVNGWIEKFKIPVQRESGHLLTACKAALPLKSKMATMGLQNGCWGLERCAPLQNKFFDLCTPSMRKEDNGEKKRKGKRK